MSKESIREEIEDFKRRGGDFSFAFGELKLPVMYDEANGTASISKAGYEASIEIDYDEDMGDNLDRLMDLLLEKYPQLTR